MFASVQSAAATLTVRHGVCAGRPVTGSMMWCMRSPPWRQRRAVVLEVARPPLVIASRCPAACGPSRWSSVTCNGQPALGAGPAVAMSPPSATSTAAPEPRVHSGGAAVGREGFRRGAEVQLGARRDPHEPDHVVDLDLPPAASATGDEPRGRLPGVPVGRIRLRERAQQLPVAVVAGLLEREPDRRVERAVGQPRTTQRQLDRLQQQRADLHGPSRTGVDAGELGVLPEAAARLVEARELPGDERDGGVELRDGVADA